MASNSLGEEAPHMGPGGRKRGNEPDGAGSTRQDRPASRSHWRSEWLIGLSGEPCDKLEVPKDTDHAERLKRFKQWANANHNCGFDV